MHLAKMYFSINILYCKEHFHSYICSCTILLDDVYPTDDAFIHSHVLCEYFNIERDKAPFSSYDSSQSIHS